MTDKTPTDLAAALLADVPRYVLADVGGMKEDAIGAYVHWHDLTAALSAALDPALAERVGEVLKGVMPYDGDPCGCAYCADNPATLWRNGEALCVECQDRQEAALVPALLTANAALRAQIKGLQADKFKMRDERDKAKIAASNYAEFNHTWRARAEAAEAELIALYGAEQAKGLASA